jgi:hypothetical protein
MGYKLPEGPAFVAIASRLVRSFHMQLLPAGRSGLEGDACPDHERIGIFRKCRAACDSGEATAGRPLPLGPIFIGYSAYIHVTPQACHTGVIKRDDAVRAARKS